VYVTHDQLEAMSMADKIAVMNRGVVEQFGTPSEIYDRPRTMFVADFMGSPPMNFLEFHAALKTGDRSIQLDEAEIVVPELRESRAASDLALGVRPEHVRFDDRSPLRGSVVGAEYLGATQIVSVELRKGIVKARISADAHVNPGEIVGLTLDGPRRSVFDRSSAGAVETSLFEGAAHG